MPKRVRKGAVAAGALALLLLSQLVPIQPAVGSDLEEVQERLTEATQRYEEAHGSLHTLESDVTRLEKQLKAAQADLEEIEVELARSAAESYTQRSTNPLLSGTDLNQQLRAQALMRSVRGDQSDVLDEARLAEARLLRLQEDLRLAEEAQLENISDLEQAQESLESELEQLKELERQRLEEERAAQQRAAEQAASARERAEAARQAAVLSRRLEFEPGDPQGDEPIASGTEFVCPVQGGHNFIDSWGFPRSGGRAHAGVDMMAAHGTLVVAPVDGNVEFRSNSLGGNSFHLSGDNGNYYYGTHLQSYEGSNRWVQAGTVIGYVGSSGNASADGPHLHFEIHPGHGSAVNPFPITSQFCEGG